MPLGTGAAVAVIAKSAAPAPVPARAMPALLVVALLAVVRAMFPAARFMGRAALFAAAFAHMTAASAAPPAAMALAVALAVKSTLGTTIVRAGLRGLFAAEEILQPAEEPARFPRGRSRRSVRG